MPHKFKNIDHTLQQSLDAFDKAFNQFSKEEMDCIVNEIDSMNLSGPTIDEYLMDFESNYADFLNSNAVHPQYGYIETTEMKAIPRLYTPALYGLRSASAYPVVMEKIECYSSLHDFYRKFKGEYIDRIPIENELTQKKSTTEENSGGFLFRFVP